MANIIRAFGGWGTGVLVLGLGTLQAAESPTDWKAGVARVDTTPTAPVWMSGYASRSSPSQGVAHPLFAKALALTDAHDHTVVLVTCDIIGFNRAFTGRVADRVKAKYGLPREDLLLVASHCHSGPTLADSTERLRQNGAEREKAQNNVDYTRDLENKLVDLVGEALKNRAPASLSYAVGRAHFALNRREKTDRGIRLGKNPAG